MRPPSTTMISTVMQLAASLAGKATGSAIFRHQGKHMATGGDTQTICFKADMDTGTAIQVNLAMATIEESEITKRLAAWASIFAVCTAFAGIWGMNFELMPELKWRYGYPVALALIVATCAILYWRFKRARWL